MQCALGLKYKSIMLETRTVNINYFLSFLLLDKFINFVNIIHSTLATVKIGHKNPLQLQ